VLVFKFFNYKNRDKNISDIFSTNTPTATFQVGNEESYRSNKTQTWSGNT